MTFSNKSLFAKVGTWSSRAVETTISTSWIVERGTTVGIFWKRLGCVYSHYIRTIFDCSLGLSKRKEKKRKEKKRKRTSRPSPCKTKSRRQTTISFKISLTRRRHGLGKKIVSSVSRRMRTACLHQNSLSAFPFAHHSQTYVSHT